MFEEYAYVFDVNKNIARVFGENKFTPLEVILKANVTIGERVYIGKDKREKVNSIKKRLTSKDLEKYFEDELLNIIEKIVKEKESYFINFLNTAGALTLKRHTLQLLPRIGQKNLKKIIEERTKKPFTSFNDFEERIDLNIVKSIAERILIELLNKDKIKIFTK